MSMGGRDCVEVGNVAGGDMGASEVYEAFVTTKVESRTRLMQGSLLHGRLSLHSSLGNGTEGVPEPELCDGSRNARPGCIC